MKARTADAEGYVEVGGVKIHYEVAGSGGPTILLLPTWTIIHKQFWKLQVAYLARHHRVVTYDGPGNGASDRPAEPAAYDQAAQVAYALAVLDATHTDRAVVVSLSRAANWALELAAVHPARVLGAVFIGPAVALGGRHPARDAALRRFDAPPPDLAPSAVPHLGRDPGEHWAKYNRTYWQEHYDDFLWFFFGQCLPEGRSTKPIEDAVCWGRETTAAVLSVEANAIRPGRTTIEGWCAQVSVPTLVVHGEEDRVIPARVGERLADLLGAEYVPIVGGGHLPLVRDPVRINLLLHDFADRVGPRVRTTRRWTTGRTRPRRVLYLSSPIGLGHARRDLAIATALREQRPDVEIDWLAQHPVTRVLAQAGERVHPASGWLVNESAHVESEAAEHDLHCFEALRRMDEILVANFQVFFDVVTEGQYDLVVGDEAWEVDHFLHENPELKRFAYAWFTDFVGYLPMPDGGAREALVAADYNAEMIEHIARYPRVRDRAIFVGDPEDVVPDRFGPGLPRIADWTREHYAFSGYVSTGAAPTDREELRAALGYRPDERVCVVTVGGSGVGHHLLRRVADAFPAAARSVPGLRMIVVTGPRIAAGAVPERPGLEIREYVPDLPLHLAACDLAVVQGGLTTCMELTAAGRPFVYVPLRHHFEQNVHVPHRLDRYGAGRRLHYEDLTPETLAAVIAQEIGRDVRYRPVATDGAQRAATLLADLV
ncbi:alpha/beta hydrolase [Cryptosporangium aurantiacum]|uniref:Predicted glycosyl transferase n=1 Tax=Cryptosporangium aurantiacum TaxID=134849 RepID=A0A1M7RBF9_9ACTN|nr:alpha/beta hydrolase [Cryptosporangium aurantiacum]SHN43398.1 Predicted glycosyl transferase [Cryptosporangium aurantiacum]